MSSITAKVCARIVDAGREKLNGKALSAARQLFLDGIAVAVAGSQLEEAPRLLSGYFADPVVGPGAGQAASLLGLKAKLGTVPAALVNGASMHVLDFEPMWLPATHALSPALSPVLALGETLGLPGEKILTGMVLGIEMQSRLRQAAGPLESHELRFHPPGFVGPLGAAVAAGHLLDFDETQFANAIGIAGSRCGGLFVSLGTMTKSSHCAYAAALGLEAALLAKRGFTGCATLFDPAPQSYGDAFFPRGFFTDTLLEFGQTLRVVDPGYAIKIFPAKFSTHYAITAALEARPQIPAGAAIRQVRVLAADVPSSDRPNPPSGLDGKFSLQYTTAVALLDGQVGLSSFSEERFHGADLQALLPKIKVTRSRDIPSLYTAGRYADVDVELENGAVIHARCERPRGSWGSPPITDEELGQKAHDCLTTFMSAGAADACIALCRQADSLDGEGLRKVMRIASTGEAA